jgi:hypothetical protein
MKIKKIVAKQLSLALVLSLIFWYTLFLLSCLFGFLQVNFVLLFYPFNVFFNGYPYVFF